MTPQEKYSERQKWFADRIGKRIFRNQTTCPCEVCLDSWNDGVLIQDDVHASCCHDFEGSSTNDGSPLRYFDTKEEAIEFQKSIKQEV